MYSTALFNDENGDPCSTIRRHDGHQLISTVDKSQLPATAILRCQTCDEELSRRPLDIRVITMDSMCFGDGNGNWANTLFVSPLSLSIDDLHGDEPLLKRIDREIQHIDARAETSTVMMGSSVKEPARIVEPVTSSFPDLTNYETERIHFEALWAATSDPARTYLALLALPLVEHIVGLVHAINYDQSIGGEEDLAHEASIRLHKALDDLHALFRPEAHTPQPEPPAPGPDWWESDDPTKTAAAPS